MIYTGIGTRDVTPQEFATIQGIAILMARFADLYSGGAQGADAAFVMGAISGRGRAVIYLPWQGFSAYLPESCWHPVTGDCPDAYQVMVRLHPAPGALTQGAEKLLTRDVHQVLGWSDGEDSYPQSSLVICCATPTDQTFRNIDGEIIPTLVKGGTGMAVRVAWRWGIPVVNIRQKGWQTDLHLLTGLPLDEIMACEECPF